MEAALAIDLDELMPRKPKVETVLGQDISTLSVKELEERIAALEAEIQRTREALKARASTRSAADSVFKR
jgi:uncharacterized small protein (DUF1192 family)